MSTALSSVFPRPKATDNDDVAWTLQTAAVQWQRGLRADAIVWVRRAADTASQTGQSTRGEELRNHAARLAEFLWSDPVEAAVSPGLSNPHVPQMPQHRGVSLLDELEADTDALNLEGYEMEVTQRAQLDSEEVTELTVDDLEDDFDDVELLEDEEDLTPPDGIPSSQVAPGDSFISIAPEDEEGRDSFISVAPEDDEGDRDSFLSVAPEESSSEPAAGSERPTQPRIGHPRPPSPSVLRGVVSPTAARADSESLPGPPLPPSDVPSGGRASSGWTDQMVRADSDPPGSSRFGDPDGPELEVSPSDADSLRAELQDAQLDEEVVTALSELDGPGPDTEPQEESSEGAHGRRVEPPVPTPRYASELDPEAPEPTSEEAEAAVEALVPMEGSLPPERPAAGGRVTTSRHPASGPARIGDVLLEEAEVLSDLPEDAQRLLVETAEVVTLGTTNPRTLEHGVALVVSGCPHVMLRGSRVSAARVATGSVVAVAGSIGTQPLDLLGDDLAPQVALWQPETLEAAMSDCPWVVDDLRLIADRFQAQAGAGSGALGERLDDALRAAVYERLEVRVLEAGEAVAHAGEPLSGLFIVAGGEMEARRDGKSRILAPGEFVHAGCVIGAQPAPTDVVAGPRGALAMYAARPLAHELMMSVPPLLEILAT